MKKNKFSLYFIFFSFLTVVTIFFSMVQKSYFNLVKPQESVVNDSLLKEFNPNLDLSVLSLIESKNKNIDDNFDFSIIRPINTDTDTSIPSFTPLSIIVPTAIPTAVILNQTTIP